MSETRAHLKSLTTDRGFSHLPALPDSQGVDMVRVFESSAADGPCIWLRLGPEGEDAVAHLDAERAWQLKEQIEWLLEHHYQGDARPNAGAS